MSKVQNKATELNWTAGWFALYRPCNSAI